MQRCAIPSTPISSTALANAIGYEPDAEEAYNYAKLGINQLAEQLAVEWGPRGVRAVSLSPGMIDSPMARAEGADLPSHDGTNSRKSRADKAQEIPMRRQGSMLEITNVVDFLVSDAASFLSGIDITVDGGHRAAWRGQGISGDKAGCRSSVPLHFHEVQMGRGTAAKGSGGGVFDAWDSPLRLAFGEPPPQMRFANLERNLQGQLYHMPHWQRLFARG